MLQGMIKRKILIRTNKLKHLICIINLYLENQWNESRKVKGMFTLRLLKVCSSFQIARRSHWGPMAPPNETQRHNKSFIMNLNRNKTVL